MKKSYFRAVTEHLYLKGAKWKNGKASQGPQRYPTGYAEE